MTTTALFDEHCKSALRAWGRYYRLDRPEAEPCDENLLERAFRGRGRSCHDPVIDAAEQHVTAIALEAPVLAHVLRAAYCGSGRLGVERWDTAKRLCKEPGMTRRDFFLRLDLAHAEFMRLELVRARRPQRGSQSFAVAIAGW